MLDVDARDIDRFERDLRTFNERAFPYATRATLNSGAFDGRKAWQGELRGNMTLRNRYTERSVLVEQARTLDVERQAAVLGSTADYMTDQEFGGTRRKRGKLGVPIPTSYAAGQAEGAKRTRMPRAANRLASVRLRRRQRGDNRGLRNMLAVREAAENGGGFVYLDLGRRRGIFRITGGKRRPRVRMVYDLSRADVRIPRNPTLAPAVAKATRRMPQHYAEALKFQLDRAKLFRNRR